MSLSSKISRLLNHLKTPIATGEKSRNHNFQSSCQFEGCIRKAQNHKASKFHKDALITIVAAPATTPDINKCLLSNVNTLQV